MLIGIMGKMGAGKTLTMSMLATYMAQRSNAPLWANYGLLNANRIKNREQLWKMENGIFCFDELWLTLDARNWENNVLLTHWVNQTRKKKLLVFYTTQHIRQVELRVRNGTDILIYCEKKDNGQIKLTFIDWQYREIGRQVSLNNNYDIMRKFYGLYDTYEIVDIIGNSNVCWKCNKDNQDKNKIECNECGVLYKKSYK